MNKQSSCDYENTIVKSLKSGFVNDEISAHIESCADCAEATKIVRFFQANLKSSSPPKSLPVAGFVWWKFKLQEKHRAAEQVARPILIAQIVAVAVFIGLLVWLLNTDFLRFSPLASALDRAFAPIEQIAVPFILGLIGFALICSTLIYGLRRFLLEK